MKPARFGFSQKLPPTVCPDCENRLGLVLYTEFLASHSEIHHRDCGQCGCSIVWSFPNVWVRRHALPLFDLDRAVVQTA